MSARHITFFIGQCLMSDSYIDPWFVGFTYTQNWNFENQYSSKNSLNKTRKLISENAKTTGNYWSPAVICNPMMHFLFKLSLFEIL